MRKALKLDVEKFVFTHAVYIKENQSREKAIKYIEEVLKDNKKLRDKIIANLKLH